MNRLIIKYGYPITATILVVFAWVVYQRTSHGDDLSTLVVSAAIVWVIGAPTFIYLWPRITVNGFKNAITRRGFTSGPVPINTLYAEPNVSSAASSSGTIMGTGTDDVLYVAGWLELKPGPQVLHVPDTDGRYYSIQLTDPATGGNFAYVGTRATGTAAGDYLITAPGWTATPPDALTVIRAPGNSVLVIGRVFVADEGDQPAAYALARQVQLSPLSQSPRPGAP